MNILDQNKHNSPEEFYASLKEKLEATHNFPENYLFKFIIPNDQNKVTEIYKIFDGMEYTLTSNESKGGKYTSCNINAFVLDADQVIKIYKEAGKIEGIMML